MKVLILANNDIGLYNFRKELIEALIKKGHTVVLSLPYGSRVDDLEKMGCRYINTEFERRSMNILKDLKLFREYMRMIKAENPDFILTYTIKPNIYGGLAARISKTAYIATITGLGTTFQRKGLLRAIIKQMYKTALKKVRSVIFENGENKRIFLGNCIINKDKAVLVSGAGVNLNEFGFSPMTFDKTLRFLFIGRIMEEKGVNEFFEVARRMKEDGYHPIAFDVIGFFEDNYKERVEELTTSGIIHYFGFQKDVKTYIQKSHCIVLPSYHEGMSNTLLESASMGRPLITSDIPGCREAVVDQKTGYLCRVRDAEDLYQKVVQYAQLSNEQRMEMGEFSRAHIEAHFDRNNVVARIIDLMGEG